MYTFKFEVSINISGFVYKDNARVKAIQILNILADLFGAVGIQIQAKELE